MLESALHRVYEFPVNIRQEAAINLLASGIPIEGILTQDQIDRFKELIEEVSTKATSTRQLERLLHNR